MCTFNVLSEEDIFLFEFYDCYNDFWRGILFFFMTYSPPVWVGLLKLQIVLVTGLLNRNPTYIGKVRNILCEAEYYRFYGFYVLNALLRGFTWCRCHQLHREESSAVESEGINIVGLFRVFWYGLHHMHVHGNPEDAGQFRRWLGPAWRTSSNYFACSSTHDRTRERAAPTTSPSRS